jgi:hypothetical protein
MGDIMKAKRVWLILVALLGLLIFNEYRSQQAQVADLRSEIAGLRVQQGRLAIDAARPSPVVRTQVAAAPDPSTTEPAPAVTAAPPEPSDNASGDPTARDKRWDEEARASLASVEEAFAAEPASGSWAVSTRLALRDRLTALSRSSSSSVGDIDCRSSICRVEVVHRDADASQHFAARAFTDPQEQAWNGPVVLLPPQSNPDGSVAVVMYLWREGTSLLKRER